MAAEVRPLRTKWDYEAALKQVERLWGAKIGTRDGDRLDVLATLIDAYEADHYPSIRLIHRGDQIQDGALGTDAARPGGDHRHADCRSQ
jgi:HTH-type transcriptional regulator / antitoxin HigA